MTGCRCRWSTASRAPWRQAELLVRTQPVPHREGSYAPPPTKPHRGLPDARGRAARAPFPLIPAKSSVPHAPRESFPCRRCPPVPCWPPCWPPPACCRPPPRTASRSRSSARPAATGMIQKNKEKPFFDEFAKRTGLAIDADYKAVDQLGIKDTEQLRVMKAGLFDIVSLRVSQNSRDEPTLAGHGPGRRRARLRNRAQGLRGLLRHAGPAAAEELPGQAAGRVALRPADPVLQEAAHAAVRSEGHEGARVRPEPGQVHRKRGRHAGAAVVHRSAPEPVAGRGRLRDHRPQLGQFVELARGDHAPVPAGLPDGAQRLRDHDEGLEPPEARRAEEAGPPPSRR